MSLSKLVDHSTAQPRIPREQVPPMSEWLKRHNRPEPTGLARWWRR